MYHRGAIEMEFLSFFCFFETKIANTGHKFGWQIGKTVAGHLGTYDLCGLKTVFRSDSIIFTRFEEF